MAPRGPVGGWDRRSEERWEGGASRASHYSGRRGEMDRAKRVTFQSASPNRAHGGVRARMPPSALRPHSPAMHPSAIIPPRAAALPASAPPPPGHTTRERAQRELAPAQRRPNPLCSGRPTTRSCPSLPPGQPLGLCAPCAETRARSLPSTLSQAHSPEAEQSVLWGRNLLGSTHASPPSLHHSGSLGRGLRGARAPMRAVAAVTSAGGVTPAGEGPVYLGYDFGTSGARVVAIDSAGTELFDAKQPYRAGDGGGGSAEEWREALFSLLESVPPQLRARAAGVSLDGTSSTALIVQRASGRPVSKPMMYNQSFSDALPAVQAIAPANHTVTTGTSTLCKLVSWWQGNVSPEGIVLAPQALPEQGEAAGAAAPGEAEAREALASVAGQEAAEALVLCHQADWLLAQLLGWHAGGVPVTTDYNNALKLGYDPGAEAYPGWLARQDYAPLLPRVVAPGAPLGHVGGAVAERWGLPAACRVVAGTTDSIAAFLAAQVAHPGEAVTSLGSTLAVKLLSRVRVDDARYGVYSHRMGDTWLVGGASNTGGAVLRGFFLDEELRSLSAGIDPSSPSTLDYYPLLRPGERFPVADPALEPRLSPRPESDAAFLHGILESMARIEARGYALLQELGASPLTLVSTAGGGAQNAVWTGIRQRVIGVPVVASDNTDAAFGAALLARDGCRGDVPLSAAGAALAS